MKPARTVLAVLALLAALCAAAVAEGGTPIDLSAKGGTVTISEGGVYELKGALADGGMLDRGLEDIEAGRTLPHDEAMAEVRRIREVRRSARSNPGAVANA